MRYAILKMSFWKYSLSIIKKIARIKPKPSFPKNKAIFRIFELKEIAIFFNVPIFALKKLSTVVFKVSFPSNKFLLSIFFQLRNP